MFKMRYYQRTENGAEYIEFDVISSSGQATVVISTELLLCGIKTFTCGNGDNIILTPQHRIKVLEFLEEQRAKTREVGVKTLEGWMASSCGSFVDYVFVGDEVDEGFVEYFRDSMPPRSMSPGYLQAGEPYNQEQDKNGRWRSTYTTFVQNGPKWTYVGECFTGETMNRVKMKSRVQQAIEKIRKELSA